MKTIFLVGAGRMGSALLQGWLDTLGPEFHFVVIDPNAYPLLADCLRHSENSSRIEYHETAAALPGNLTADAIILATKPQMVTSVLRTLNTQIDPETLVVSIAAGVTTETIISALQPSVPVVRAMPNIGALVGHSASAGFASPGVSQSARSLTETLFKAIGSYSWLADEDAMHCATAVSGSGPAYVFELAEAMIEAAMHEGLSSEAATALVLSTLAGAGRLLEKTSDPSHLRETVTSPNGTTAAGLAALKENSGLAVLIGKTIAAAKHRSIEISKELP